VIGDPLNMANHKGKTVKSYNSTTNWDEGIHVEQKKILINNIKFNIFPIEQDIKNFPKDFINFHFGFNIPLAISPTSTLYTSWVKAGNRIIQNDKHIVAYRPVTR
jgi:hypothetical protein